VEPGGIVCFNSDVETIKKGDPAGSI